MASFEKLKSLGILGPYCHLATVSSQSTETSEMQYRCHCSFCESLQPALGTSLHCPLEELVLKNRFTTCHSDSWFSDSFR